MSDTIFVMLLTYEGFAASRPRPSATRARLVEMLLDPSCERNAQVDALVAKAVAAGGTTHDGPEDLGFM